MNLRMSKSIAACVCTHTLSLIPPFFSEFILFNSIGLCCFNILADCYREVCKYIQWACQVQEIHVCLFSKAVNVFSKGSVAKLHKPTT